MGIKFNYNYILDKGFTNIAISIKEKEFTVPIIIRLMLEKEILIFNSICNDLMKIILVIVKQVLYRYRLDLIYISSKLKLLTT